MVKGGKVRKIFLLEGQGVDGGIILKCIIKKWNGNWCAFFWIRMGTHGGSSAYGEEASFSII
jgi:hypothetical protein